MLVVPTLGMAVPSIVTVVVAKGVVEGLIAGVVVALARVEVATAIVDVATCRAGVPFPPPPLGDPLGWEKDPSNVIQSLAAAATTA